MPEQQFWHRALLFSRQSKQKYVFTGVNTSFTLVKGKGTERFNRKPHREDINT
jgi:hypothetical protein